MTRHRLAALLVVTAVAIVVVGSLARPLLIRAAPAPTGPTLPTATTVTAAPAGALDVARHAATTSICTGLVRSCPPATVERAQGYCPTQNRCLVALVITRTAHGMLVPIGVAVTVTRDTTGWHVAQVRS